MRLGTTLSEHPRVLLVDDNEQMLDTATSVLSDEFDIVGAVRDGRSALEAAGAVPQRLAVAKEQEGRQSASRARW